MRPPLIYNPDTQRPMYLHDPEEDYVDDLTEWHDYDPDC